MVSDNKMSAPSVRTLSRSESLSVPILRTLLLLLLFLLFVSPAEGRRTILAMTMIPVVLLQSQLASDCGNGLCFLAQRTVYSYRNCAEGCCLHEYCAYHKICYPKIHCGLGCPDGTCHQDVCMPPPPCNTSTRCGLGHACLFHYNLGYSVCQYNLDIGKSLCVDSKGKSILRPFT